MYQHAATDRGIAEHKQVTQKQETHLYESSSRRNYAGRLINGIPELGHDN
jgi:hypothetical protein